MTDHSTEEHERVRLTSDVIALSADSDWTLHVLLIRRRWEPFEGLWALPGGHVDPGETVEAAAGREFKEETGLELVDVPSGMIVHSSPGRDPRGRYVTFVHVDVRGEMDEPTPADDAVDARWWPVDEITPEMLAFDHWNILSRFLDARVDMIAGD